VTRHGIAPQSIARVEVETFLAGVKLGTAVPATTEAAQYALGFPLAAFLVHGRLGAAEIGPAGLADPAIAAMIGKIRLSEREDLSSAFPARRLAFVKITLVGGDVLMSEMTSARGDASEPLSDAELIAKFDALGEGCDARTWRFVAETCMQPDLPAPRLAEALGLILAPCS
jgi:2-methylcitrate dehydratase PrpD